MSPHDHTHPGAPFAVTHAAAVLTEQGYTPTVHANSSTRWSVEANHDDVRVLIRFKAPILGTARITEATFTLGDDKQYTLCCPEHVAANVKTARGYADNDEPAVPDPLPPSRPISEAPPKLRHRYHLLTHRLPDDQDTIVTVGATDTGTWVMAMDMPGATVRMYFRRSKGRWDLDKRRPMQVILDGVDYSDYVGDDFEALLALLGGNRNPVEAPSSIGSAADAKRVNSVQVRRSTVIRV